MVTVFDVVVEVGTIYLVMEYVPSRSLAELMAEEGPLGPGRFAAIGAQVADGLAAAHAAGITHRDVKPGNVLVTEDRTAKISDFGIARTATEPTLTQSGFVTGAPAYFSPELARGARPGPAADVWTLGATLYAAVEGRPLYDDFWGSMSSVDVSRIVTAPGSHTAGITLTYHYLDGRVVDERQRLTLLRSADGRWLIDNDTVLSSRTR